MFQKIEQRNLEELSREEFTLLNDFMSLSPQDWVTDFSAKWIEVLKTLEISIDNFNVNPILNVRVPNSKVYSYILEDEEAFLYIPKPQLNKFGHKIKLFNESDTDSVLFGILTEYLVRKLLGSIISHWNSSRPPSFQYIGLESSEKDDVLLDKAMGIGFEVFGIEFQIYMFIPDNIYKNFCSQFPRFSYLNLINVQQYFTETVNIRLDYCSLGIPTKTLIDVLRKDGILNLSDSVKIDRVGIVLDDEWICDGILKNYSGGLVSQFIKSKEVRLPSLSAQQTLLTVSLGGFEISSKDILDMPSALLLTGISFSQVQLLVGNEVVAHGVMGYDDLGNLVVRVE